MTSNVNNIVVNDFKNAIQDNIPDIVDNLTTTDSTKVLSAKQGKILYEMIQAVDTGIELVTNISISSNYYSVEQNTDIALSGTLSAVYDGAIDLIGTLKDATVKIYDGNTLVDTVTTDNTGAYTSTIALTSIGSHSLKAVFEGDGKIFDDCESSAVVVYCTNTIITLNVPMNLIYSDAFNITGVLKDTSNNLLECKTVSLLVGSTVVDTSTTDSNGEFSFTQTPVSMGTHSFQVTWAGDNVYYASGSSIVTREIGKETGVLNVSSPTMNTNVYSDGSLTVTGTLQSNDAEAIAGASILVKQGNSTLATLTTDSYGAFTGSVSGANLITGDLNIIFETTSTHTASSQTVAIVVNDPTLALVSDKDILSYANHDVATLTATLQCANPSGKTVSFDIVDSGGTVISNIDTAVTDSSGVCSVSYSSNGAGVIYIRANQGIFLSETYEVEDCIRHIPFTSQPTGAYHGNFTITYGSDGMTVASRPGGFIYLTDVFPSTFEAEYTITGGNTSYNMNEFAVGGCHCETDHSYIYCGEYNGSNCDRKSQISGNITIGDKITIKADTSTIEYYVNDNLITTRTRYCGNSNIFLWGGYNMSTTYKDLKIKPL